MDLHFIYVDMNEWKDPCKWSFLIDFSCGPRSWGRRTFLACNAWIFTYLMWWWRCVGCVVVWNSNQRALFGRSRFPGKFYLLIHIRATRNVTTMSTKEAINFWFSFYEIRDNQRKVVGAYLSDRDVWMVAPTSSAKSLDFWSLESLLSLFTDPALPRSSFICDKNCFLISRIISKKVVVVSGAVSFLFSFY